MNRANYYTTINNISYFIGQNGSHYSYDHTAQSWLRLVDAPFEIDTKKLNLLSPFIVGATIGALVAK